MIGKNITENGMDLSTTIHTIESHIRRVLPSPSDRIYVTNARRHSGTADRYCWMLDHFQLELIRKTKHNKERMVLSFDPYFLEVNGEEKSIDESNIILYKWKEMLEDIKADKAVAFRSKGKKR